jgi:hypothetical protein
VSRAHQLPHPVHAAPNALQHQQSLGDGGLSDTVLANQQRRVPSFWLQLKVLKAFEVMDIQALQHTEVVPETYLVQLSCTRRPFDKLPHHPNRYRTT